MSKNLAPGSRFALYSSLALRFVAGMCHDASTTCTSFPHSRTNRAFTNGDARDMLTIATSVANWRRVSSSAAVRDARGERVAHDVERERRTG